LPLLPILLLGQFSVDSVAKKAEKSKQQGQHFFKYKECDLETQIATHTNQDT
jgi:hypothetical protein